ncbi:MAG TPA: cell division protein FtsZ, partial [Rhodocyclaceae bacterium]|nr:cell division protein FtsZ [Rhodocyclaceae bacterium]
EKLQEVLGDEVSMKQAFREADNVLRNAVGGIAEIINIPGLVNVDFEDVKTVMGEMGKAMMGSSTAVGVDRARIAADQAVASPLLEGIELSGARGVLVNITASDELGMKEVREVMNTIRTYAAPDATIIFGTVFDNSMEDALRVTVVATGLGGAIVKAAKPVLKTVMNEGMGLRTGTDNQVVDMGGDVGGMFTSARSSARNTMVETMAASGVDKYDIPAFLRRQAD